MYSYGLWGRLTTSKIFLKNFKTTYFRLEILTSNRLYRII